MATQSAVGLRTVRRSGAGSTGRCGSFDPGAPLGFSAQGVKGLVWSVRHVNTGRTCARTWQGSSQSNTNRRSIFKACWGISVQVGG